MDTVDSAKKYNIINHLYPARASPSIWPSLSLSAALEVQNLERTKVKESGKRYGGGRIRTLKRPHSSRKNVLGQASQTH